MIKFDASTIKITGPKTGGFKSGYMMMVVLDDIEVNKLFSKDGSNGIKNRELVAELTFSNQPSTTISWETDKNGKPNRNFKGQVLYYGKQVPILPIQIGLIEQDEDIRKKIEEVSKVTGILSSAAARIPTYGSAAQAGLSMTTTFLGILKGRIDDDLELVYHGSLVREEISGTSSDIPKLRPGRYTLTRGEDDIKIVFDIYQIDPNKLETDERIIILLKEIKFKEVKKEDFLKFNDINFNFSFGPDKKPQTINIKYPSHDERFWKDKFILDKVLGFQGLQLYQGELRNGVPFDISITLTGRRRDKDISNIIAAANAVSNFIGEVVEKEIVNEVNKITKAVQTYSTKIQEFSSDSKTLWKDAAVFITKEQADALRNILEYLPGGYRTFTFGDNIIDSENIQITLTFLPYKEF